MNHQQLTCMIKKKKKKGRQQENSYRYKSFECYNLPKYAWLWTILLIFYLILVKYSVSRDKCVCIINRLYWMLQCARKVVGVL
jgi:hypothetical protein